MESNYNRREILRLTTVVGAGMALSGCGKGGGGHADEKKELGKAEGGEPDEEVTAVEDLMREHGVLRRALLVYTAAVSKLRNNAAAVAPETLQKTATLFRAFGEDYHEKKLEEAYIFPAVKKAGGEAAGYMDILVTQHNRGREITEYILAVTRGAKLGAASAESLAKALEAFVLMYQHHTAREDTIVFPAWKKTLKGKELEEMGEKFEEIEHQQFGKDGFEDAVKQISQIEGALGLTDIAQFTAPPPPKT